MKHTDEERAIFGNIKYRLLDALILVVQYNLSGVAEWLRHSFAE